MNAEEYGSMKQRLIDAIPNQNIVINLPKKLTISTPHGYLRFNHMEMDAELLDGLPQQTIDAFHNKLVVLHGEEPEGQHWVNLGKLIMGEDREYPENAKKAVGWLNAMFKLREFLEQCVT